jgi:hypothetical protein
MQVDEPTHREVSGIKESRQDGHGSSSYTYKRPSPETFGAD